MADFILQATLSNLLVSALLAAVAWIIQQRYQSAALANLLWVMVLLKMVTPPLFALPLVEVAPIATHDPPVVVVAPMLTDLPLPSNVVTAGQHPPVVTPQPATVPLPWFAWLGWTWISVSALLLVVSLGRVIRFHYHLQRQLLPATGSLIRLSRRAARQIGLQHEPPLAITRANISPFVWWTGGRPLVVVPQLAIDGLSDDDLQMILAHELIHVKRGDHYVRWLEWLAGLTLWWNPVLWVARGQLRTTEEIACDALVVQSLRPAPRDYARSLLNMAELLTTSTIRPPAVASAINSGGTLEKRLTMILKPTNLKLSTWTGLTVVAMAASLFPLGLVYAQDYEAIEKRLGQAVKAGEITKSQAGAMVEALKESSQGEQERASSRQQYAEAVERIKQAVEAGDVTKEQAEQRMKMLAERLRRSGQQETDRDMEAKKRDYMAAAEKIKGMLKQGKVLKADAEEKLIELRKKMLSARSPAEVQQAKAMLLFMEVIQRRMSTGGVGDPIDDMEAQKQRYMEGARRIEAAVEAGEVSQEDAKKRLVEMRKKMFPERVVEGRPRVAPELEVGVPLPTKAPQETRKKEYMAAEEKIQAMVKAGKISKEEADQLLLEMRKTMSPERGAPELRIGVPLQRTDVKVDVEAAKRRYEEGARRIEMAVESGQMTQEEADQLLLEMRKTMFPKSKVDPLKSKK